MNAKNVQAENIHKKSHVETTNFFVSNQKPIFGDATRTLKRPRRKEARDDVILT